MKTKTFFRFFLLGVMTLFTLGAWAQTETPDYLCFTATGASSVTLNKNGSPAEVTLQTSEDGTNWSDSDYAFGTAIELADGDKVYFRNAADGVTEFSTSSWNYYQFAMTGSIAASGNVMSLVDKSVATTTIPCDYCFCRLFYNCTTLTNAADLKLLATELKSNCYGSMFYNCTGLETAPALPATTLASSCYSSMFSGCTSLTTAPTILPATTLASSCYSSMFSGCTSLTTTPELPATTLASSCYSSMFSGCTSLKTAPALPATTLASYCYSSMFKGCEKLTAAPALNATTLAERCCQSMFEGCINLATAPKLLPAETLANECYSSMFKGCEKLTAAPELNATTLAKQCCQSMFEGCINLATAPTLLPAETLATSCYSAMFKGCKSLETAPALPAKTTAQSCYLSMFEGCTKLTTAPELPATTLVQLDYTSMFNGCTNLNYVKIAFTGTLGSTYSREWLKNVASTGTFVCPAEAGIASRSNHTVPAGWKVTYEITAHQDPENKGNYYATFYSSTEACQVPEGVTAYTAEVDGDVLKLTPIAGNIIPAEEGVVLKLTSTDDTEATAHFLLKESTGGKKSDSNALTGTSTAISKKNVTQDDYALSSGNNGVGFYPFLGKTIGAHKAYLTLGGSAGAKAFIFQFDDATSIHNSQFIIHNSGIDVMYNLNGVRVNDGYKGIVIKNGKKYYNK